MSVRNFLSIYLNSFDFMMHAFFQVPEANPKSKIFKNSVLLSFSGQDVVDEKRRRMF